MIKQTKVQLSPKRFTKKVEYVEPIREGSTAQKKEAITSKYSESYQLNVMTDALIELYGDKESQTKEKLIEISNHVKGVIDG